VSRFSDKSPLQSVPSFVHNGEKTGYLRYGGLAICL
jgi:hypothetical protein